MFASSFSTTRSLLWLHSKGTCSIIPHTRHLPILVHDFRYGYNKLSHSIACRPGNLRGLSSLNNPSHPSQSTSNLERLHDRTETMNPAHIPLTIPTLRHIQPFHPLVPLPAFGGPNDLAHDDSRRQRVEAIYERLL